MWGLLLLSLDGVFIVQISMLSLTNFLDLLVLSIPLVTAYLHGRQVLLKLQRKEPVAAYWFNALVSLAAILFALWLYSRMQG